MKNRKHPFILFYRFIMMYLIVILIPVIILNAFVNKFYFGYIKENLEANSLSSLHKVEEFYQNQLDTLDNLSKQMQLSDRFESFYLKQTPINALHLANDLRALLVVHPFLQEIFVQFTNDPYIYSSSGCNSAEMFYKQTWVNSSVYSPEMIHRIQNATSPFTIPLHTVSGYHNPGSYVGYVYPLNTDKSNHSGAVIFYISQETYQEVFDNINTSFCNSYIKLNDQLILEDLHIDLPDSVQESMMQSTNPIEHISHNQEEYLLVQSDQNRFNMKFCQIFSLKDIYKPLYQRKNLLLLINVVILLLCGTLMFYFSVINYHPIRSLIRSIESVKAIPASERKNEWTELLEGFADIYEQNRVLHLKYDKSQKARRVMLLLDFIKGRFVNKDNFLTICREENFDIAHPYFSIILMKSDAASAFFLTDDPISQMLNEPFGDVYLYSAELLHRDEVVIAAFFDYPGEFRTKLELLWEQLTAKGFVGAAAVSEIYCDGENAPKALIEASTALSLCQSQKNQLLFFPEAKNHLSMADGYPFELIANFQKAVDGNQIDSMVYQTDQIFSFLRSHNFPPMIIQNILKDVTDVLIKRSIELKMDSTKLYQLYTTITLTESELDLEKFEKTIREIGKDFSEVVAYLHHLPDSNLDSSMMVMIRYLNDNCLDPNFTLYSMAEHFKISPSQLSASFKNALNISPLAYVTGYKIRMAKRLLTESHDDIASICTKLGYCDTSSFIRKFKQQTGKTPLVYRQDFLKEHSKE